MFTKIEEMRHRREQGFTLTELLVVILIIGVLTAIAVPAYLNQRKTSYDAAVKTDLGNAALALDTWMVDCPDSPVTPDSETGGVVINSGYSSTGGTGTAGTGACTAGFNPANIRVSPYTKLVVKGVTGNPGAYTICGFNNRGNKAVTAGFYFNSATGGLTETKPTHGSGATYSPGTNCAA